MRFKLNNGVTILMCAGLAMSGLTLDVIAEEDPAALEKVEVTGSHIKRVDIEGPSPVLVIDRKDIDASGGSTVAEVLRSITSNTGPSFDEKFTNSFAPGSSGISLRGLGQDATLVLLNGRRMANYGFAQNINDSFVDLNSIPLGAIERIEVLKDGASAIYGSDAIAGVINIILRKDFDGAEATVDYGASDKNDGNTSGFNLLTGTTNANSNLTFNLNYFRRKAVMLSDRDFSASANHDGQEDNDGYDFSSSANPVSNVRSAETGDWLAINGFFDYNPYITMIPATERLGAMINYNRELTADVNLYTQLIFNQNQTDAQAAPTPLFGDNEDVVVSADNPYNTYGEDVYTRWRMLEAGPRLSHIETDSYRFLTGLNGMVGAWDWDAGFNFSRSKTVDTGSNYINRLALISAIDEGEINPFGTTENDPDTMESIKASTSRTAVSEQKGLDAKTSTEIMELDAGSVGLALGMEYTEQSLKDSPDKLSEEGQIIGSGGTSSEGDRELTSAYVELSVPVLETLEMQLAVRHENYSDFGTTTNPKVALRFQPTDWVMVRGSWGTGFRAPSLPELYLGASESHNFLIDTTRCEITGADADCGGSQYQVVFSGNPDLDPEESTSWYLGLVVEPMDDLTIGIDYWKYDHTNIIDTDTQYILDHEDAYPDVVVRSDPAFDGDPGEIIYINDSFINISDQKTDGFDLDIKYEFDIEGIGDFGVQTVATYVRSFERRPVADEPYEELLGTYQYPKWRATAALDWERGDYKARLATNYIDSYEQFYTDWDDEISYVDSMWTWDAQFVYSGIESTDITLGVLNLTDEEPPFSNSEIEGYDFATHNPMGRFIYTRLNYAF
ncbi:MAG: TonB-dependent receptor [Pseudomonadota bacterium]